MIEPRTQGDHTMTDNSAALDPHLIEEAIAGALDRAMTDLKEYRISALGGHPYGMTDDNGIRRLDLNDVARIAAKQVVEMFGEHV